MVPGAFDEEGRAIVFGVFDVEVAMEGATVVIVEDATLVGDLLGFRKGVSVRKTVGMSTGDTEGISEESAFTTDGLADGIPDQSLKALWGIIHSGATG